MSFCFLALDTHLKPLGLDGRNQQLPQRSFRPLPLLWSLVNIFQAFGYMLKIASFKLLLSLSVPSSSTRKYVEQFSNGVTVICEFSVGMRYIAHVR